MWSPNTARGPERQRWILVCFAALALGCSDDDASAPDPLDGLDEADEARLDGLEREAAAHAGTEQGAEAALEGARLALRLGHDRAHADRAAALLSATADAWELQGSCAALEELSRARAIARDRRGEAVARARGALRECPGAWTRLGEGAATEAARRMESGCRLAAIEVRQQGTAARVVATLLPGPLRESCAFQEERPEDGTHLLRIDHLVAAPTAQEAEGAGPVRSVSVDGHTIVTELEPGADPRTFFLLDPLRAVIDVVPPVAEVPDGPLVVIDPGHGGEETGAQFDGLSESVLVLDLAQRAARVLQRRAPSVRVVLTRTDDVQMPLEDRAARANELDADLFVSLHLNAADEPVRIGGVTTFVLDTTDDRQALRLAARENGTNAASVSQLQRLLAGLHREEQLEGSRQLAEAVHATTLAAGRRHLPELPDRGVKSALFYVLVGARMPAILLEASFLTKAEEADALKTDGYRQALAQGIAAGILRYLTARASASPEE
ncbi:MAG: N-acetylmuramoyl-L-alanine amidase [Deltaproteobacteria bacterium]|nr:N-acetylmuramoyl-L-alanine amidase [Deltaproteobacteria bacterium]